MKSKTRWQIPSKTSPIEIVHMFVESLCFYIFFFVHLPKDFLACRGDYVPYCMDGNLFMQMMQTILIVVVNLLEKQVPKCIPFSCLGIIVSCNFSANLSYRRNENISMMILFQEQRDCMSSAELYLTEKLASVLYHWQLEHLPAEYYGKVMITKRNINVYALTSLFYLEGYSKI